MVGLKKFIMNVLIALALALNCFMMLVCFAYTEVDGIVFKINGTDISFNGLCYGNLKRFELQPNTVFIVTDGEEQVDITTCECDDNDFIKSITVVLTNTNQVCDFSVYGIKIGDVEEVVTSNMPKETEHMLGGNEDIMISRYIDKDNNVVIVGTDIELNVVSYITIRIRE